MQTGPGSRAGRWLLRLCGSALILSAVLKLLSIFISGGLQSPLLAAADMVFYPLKKSTVLTGAAFVDLAVASYLLLAAEGLWHYVVLVWFTTLCFAYRFVLYTLSMETPCGCGGFWPKEYQEAIDSTLLTLLLMLTAVGWTGLIKAGLLYPLLLRNWRRPRSA